MRIGVVSDIHCQHEALAAAIEAMGPVGGIICLGDCIDQARYCPRTIALLRESGAFTIRGNHDDAYLASLSSAHETSDGLLWLASRPARLSMEIEGCRVVAVHSTGWAADHPYITRGHPQFGKFGETDADFILYGHTHQPLVEALGQKTVVNPGSIGEGRPEASGFVRSFAIIDTAARTASIIDID